MPTGWSYFDYWSATPSPSGHAGVNLGTGAVIDGSDSDWRYAAYQVL